jgi:hypothetical protein
MARAKIFAPITHPFSSSTPNGFRRILAFHFLIFPSNAFMNFQGLFTFSLLLILLPALLLSQEFSLKREAEFNQLHSALLALEKSSYLQSETELNFDAVAQSSVQTALSLDSSSGLLALVNPELVAAKELSEGSSQDALLHSVTASLIYSFLWRTEVHYSQTPSISFYLLSLDPGHYASALEKLYRPSSKAIPLQDPAFLLELPTLFLIESEKGEFIWTGGRKGNRTLLGLIQTNDFNQAFLIPVNYRFRVDFNASP